jgi:hypothetical protein
MNATSGVGSSEKGKKLVKNKTMSGRGNPLFRG